MVEFLNRLKVFALLLLVQALVLNHVRLLGYATPLLYVYFVETFRRGYPRWAMMLWSFLLGIILDTFTDTPGVATGAMTLIAFAQPYVLELFMQRDSDESIRPGIRAMGGYRFSVYSAILSTAYSFAFFTLEMFSFFNWLTWLLSSLGSALLTWLLIMVIDNLKRG